MIKITRSPTGAKTIQAGSTSAGIGFDIEFGF